MSADVNDLTDQEKAVLDFERRWYRLAGSKEQAIHDEFGLSAVRYYQLLNKLLTVPAALEYAATVVNRLRGARDRAARVR